MTLSAAAAVALTQAWRSPQFIGAWSNPRQGLYALYAIAAWSNVTVTSTVAFGVALPEMTGVVVWCGRPRRRRSSRRPRSPASRCPRSSACSPLTATVEVTVGGQTVVCAGVGEVIATESWGTVKVTESVAAVPGMVLADEI